jgi:hypothetical protein
VQDDGVAEVQVGRGRIQSELDLEGDARGAGALELGPQLGLDDDLGGAAPDEGELLGYGEHVGRDRGILAQPVLTVRRSITPV